jgi:hypothetical protein
LDGENGSGCDGRVGWKRDTGRDSVTDMRMAAVAVCVALLGGCSDVCSNTVLSRTDAPGRQHSAIMFQRDCGATTGFSTQVSIEATGQAATEAGNAFRADDDHGAAAAGGWGGPWAEMRWLAPDHLLIRYAAKSRIFKRAETVDGVRVSYEPVTS